jgi:hypothetical protein
VRTARKLAEAWRLALLTRNAASFGALFAESAVFLDVEHREPEDRLRARPLHGPIEIEAVTRDWLDRTPEFRYDILRSVGDDLVCALLWEYELPGAEPFTGLTWIEAESGLIVRAFVAFDSLALLGAHPAEVRDWISELEAMEP